MGLLRLPALPEWVVDTVFPKRCAGCGRRGVWLCGDCDAGIDRFVPPWCARCGLPDRYAPCHCGRGMAAVDRLRAAGGYDGPLRAAVLQMKFADESARAASLGEMLIPLLADFGPVDGLVPVPLHWRRLRERGYNQSLLLARAAATAGIAVRDDLLARVRATPHQVGLGAAGRLTNVAGAFAVPAGTDCRGLRLVLVDDVLTTGATVEACAVTLKAAGARFVGVVTVARALPGTEMLAP